MNCRHFLPTGQRPGKALFLSLFLCVSLTGCGGGGGGSASVVPAPTPPTPTPTPTPLPAAAVTTVSAPALQFTVSLAEDTASVAVGGAVVYTLSLTNTSSSTATVIVTAENGQTVPQAVLRVADSSGTTVYPVAHPGIAHAGPPPAPPALDLPVTLAPGQSLTPIHRSVSAFSAAGTYQATAAFTVAPTNSDPVQTVTLPPLFVTVH